MRGEILNLEAGEGVIAGADGNRYRFAAADLRRLSVQAGSTVDFVAKDETAHDIYPLTGSGGADVANRAIAAVAAAFAPVVTPTFTVEKDRGLLAYFFRAATDDYARFRGRARRKEYWGYLLFYTIFLLLILTLLTVGFATSRFPTDTSQVKNLYLSPMVYIGSMLLLLFLFGLIVPSLAVMVRRLHDIGRSGWWLWLHIVPGIGSLVLLIMTLLKGEAGPNRFGPPMV